MSGISVTDIAANRHTVRAFLDKSVPRDVLEQCLELAQKAPSNSNVQPWRLHILEGPSLKRVSKALQNAVGQGQKATTLPIPDPYKHYQSEMGHGIYGKDGYNIPREDKERLESARRRNYNFFDAQTALIVSMDSRLADIDTLSVGFYLHTLWFLLAERGVSASYQVSVAGYPDVLRQELGIEEHMTIFCGMAIGYEDKGEQINGLRIPRDDWKDHVKFVES